MHCTFLVLLLFLIRRTFSPLAIPALQYIYLGAALDHGRGADMADMMIFRKMLFLNIRAFQASERSRGSGNTNCKCGETFFLVLS